MAKTFEAVRLQLAAMGADVFEIGIYRPAQEREEQEAQMLLRTWDAETLMRSLRWLRFQNLEGRNIYIRPNGEHRLSLVDDLTAETICAMKDSEFDPAVVVETSPGNYQAWLNHGRTLPKDVSTAAARELAAKFGGDRGAADWRHFGRLAGFTNRKEKYRQPDGLFPFVRLIEHSGAAYSESDRFVANIARQVERARQASERRRETPVRSATVKQIGDFMQNPAFGGDGHRIDIAYAVYALAHGVSDTDVRAAIAKRDLTKKGGPRRQAEYIDRTIQKALATVQNRSLGR
jgi:hypothetical protein